MPWMIAALRPRIRPLSGRVPRALAAVEPIGTSQLTFQAEAAARSSGGEKCVDDGAYAAAGQLELDREQLFQRVKQRRGWFRPVVLVTYQPEVVSLRHCAGAGPVGGCTSTAWETGSDVAAVSVGAPALDLPARRRRWARGGRTRAGEA